MQEARSRAAAASRAACAREASPVPAETHASSLAHELEVTRRQLAEARCELELRRGSGGSGGAELTVSTPPPMRHGLQWSPSTTAHSQESQRLVTSDHAVLTEQVSTGGPCPCHLIPVPVMHSASVLERPTNQHSYGVHLCMAWMIWTRCFVLSQFYAEGRCCCGLQS